MTNAESLIGLVEKIREQAVLLERMPLQMVDELTLWDVDKAYRQFAANVERTITDAYRRLAPVDEGGK